MHIESCPSCGSRRHDYPTDRYGRVTAVCQRCGTASTTGHAGPRLNLGTAPAPALARVAEYVEQHQGEYLRARRVATACEMDPTTAAKALRALSKLRRVRRVGHGPLTTWYVFRQRPRRGAAA